MLKFNYVPILSLPYPWSLSLIIASFIQSWWWNLICIGSKYWKVTNQFQLQVIHTPFIHYSLQNFFIWNIFCAHVICYNQCYIVLYIIWYQSAWCFLFLLNFEILHGESLHDAPWNHEGGYGKGTSRLQWALTVNMLSLVLMFNGWLLAEILQTWEVNFLFKQKNSTFQGLSFKEVRRC